MPEFKTVDLGQIFQTGEALKGMKRQAESDRLRNIYTGVQTDNARQQGQIAQDENQRAQAEAQAKASAIDAQRVYHVSDAVYRSDHPVDAVKNLAPDFIQQFEATHGAGSFAQLPEDQVKNLFGQMRERSMVAAGIQPKYSAPIAGQKDGQPVYFQTDETGNPRVVPGIAPPPKTKGAGISFRSPDGTEVQIGGDGNPQYPGVDLTKANQTKLQDAFINAQGNSYALREQLNKYRPEFSTLGGQFKAGIADLKGKVGMDNAPQQQQFLTDYTSWKADTASLLSQYLNQLSGAAISPAEEARLKSGFPNADDGPDVYQAKAAATLRRFSLVQARAAYLLSNPGQQMSAVSLDKMGEIVASEANKLAESYKRGGMDAETAKARAITATRQRMGLDSAPQ